ncbi:MAG TPA: PTS sugar transporter subunit IIA [Eubacteriaceae bacterium]|nr:PTS sugar transporter subunit IIA [Eubacteriaceae bacterium]
MADLGLTFSKELILTGIKASTDLEAIETAAKYLLEKGLVKESYVKAIQEREKVFATGLPTEGFGVAVPHTDVEHVNEQTICIGIMENPVPFKVMGSMDEIVDVKIMFMLALKEPHSQLTMLQAVIGMVQKPEVLEKLAIEKDTGVIYDLVMNELENMEIEE